MSGFLNETQDALRSLFSLQFVQLHSKHSTTFPTVLFINDINYFGLPCSSW